MWQLLRAQIIYLCDLGEKSYTEIYIAMDDNGQKHFSSLVDLHRYRMASSSNLWAQSPIKIDILIVGGGIAGLAAAFCLGRSGHRVTVIEQGKFLDDSGAGIQLSPSKLFIYSPKNSACNTLPSNKDVSRLLIRWGLKACLDTIGVKPVSASFNRCECCPLFKTEEFLLILQMF